MESSNIDVRYLYGATEEKFRRLGHQQTTRKTKPLDTYRFKLSPLLEGKRKMKPGEASIRYKTTPDTLVELCSTVVNDIPLPDPFRWTTIDVTDWIRKLGLKQYQNTFKKNFINGRTLLRMDASYLVKINIKDFGHILIITDSIRHLYKFNRSSYKRSISMPDRTPDALYKFFRVRTGPKYERTRRTDLFRRLHLLRPPPLYETHWQTLERWVKHLRPIDKELIGGTVQKRYNLYYPPKAKVRPLPIVDRKTPIDCDCMPPCSCKWTNEKQLRESWRLKSLRNRPISRKHTTGITLLKVFLPRKYAVVTSDNLQVSATALDRIYQLSSSERVVRLSARLKI